MRKVFIILFAAATLNHIVAQTEVYDSIPSRRHPETADTLRHTSLNEVLVTGEKPQIKG